MTLRFRYSTGGKLVGGLVVLAGVGLASCRHDTVVPNPVVDYYPLTVGTYRAYTVTDTVWSKGKATPTAYQLREAITEQFTDAAGLPAYRVVRARRASSSAAWVDDSVLVVQPQTQAVLLTRNNVRTVELIYPLQANKSWRKYAFTNIPRPDSVSTRAFAATVGQAFTTPGAMLKTYEVTALVRDKLATSDNDGNFRQGGYLQVFALNVGPVLRRRYAYQTYTTQNNGAQILTPGVIQTGSSRLEVLVDSGKL